MIYEWRVDYLRQQHHGNMKWINLWDDMCLSIRSTYLPFQPVNQHTDFATDDAKLHIKGKQSMERKTKSGFFNIWKMFERFYFNKCGFTLSLYSNRFFLKKQ